jgi:hypothetical protein
MYQLSFNLLNAGIVEVSFEVPFGGLTVLYDGFKPSSDKMFFANLSNRVQLVSIKANDSFNFKWNRFTHNELKIEILKQVLDIKKRDMGFYVQDAKFNWLP